MKKFTLLFLIIPIAFSCTSSFKTLQTPDDVYYSPAIPRTVNLNEEKRVENNNTPTVIVNNGSYRPDYNDEYYYRRRRRYYDNDDYKIYKQPSSVVITPRTENLSTYKKHPTPAVSNPKMRGFDPNATNSNSGTPVRTFKRSNGSVIGNVVRKLISGSTSIQSLPSGNSRQENSNQSNNSNNSSSAGKSSSSTSAPVRTFNKKN